MCSGVSFKQWLRSFLSCGRNCSVLLSSSSTLFSSSCAKNFSVFDGKYFDLLFISVVRVSLFVSARISSSDENISLNSVFTFDFDKHGLMTSSLFVLLPLSVTSGGGLSLIKESAVFFSFFFFAFINKLEFKVELDCFLATSEFLLRSLEGALRRASACGRNESSSLLSSDDNVSTDSVSFLSSFLIFPRQETRDLRESFVVWTTLVTSISLSLLSSS